jgi:hypothetical protein
MTRNNDIDIMIDNLLDIDLSNISADKKEEIIYSINEIVIDLQSVSEMIKEEDSLVV